MSFYNYNDIELENKINEIKTHMKDALKLIDICNNDPASDYHTQSIERDIKRFLEDH